MKQDRIHPRTAVDLQRKYGRKVAKTAVVAEDAAKEATQAAASAESAAKAAAEATKDLTELEAKLELTLKVNENGEVISEINGVANVIKFLANCIRIESDYFTLNEDGTVSIKMTNGETVTGHIRMGNMNRLAVESADFDQSAGSGFQNGLTYNGMHFMAGESGAGVMPMQFFFADGEYWFTLDSRFMVGGMNIAEKLADFEARLKALEGS